MKKTVFFSFLLIFSLIVFTNKIFADYWAKTYGGSSEDWPYSIQQTSDGGFIVAGETESFENEYGDYWILKLDSNGNVQWEKTYGGSDDGDEAFSIQQTSDGGFIVAGYTSSFGAGASDYWILKLDSDGNVQWEKTYGGSSYDEASSIQQTSDGGFIVAGYTYSFGAGGYDYWILKLDSNGNVQWQKTYGGGNIDWATSIQQTSDGGFIVAGNTSSFGAGDYDYWILKLYDNGSIQWQKTYGGSDDEEAYSIQQTSDGGFIVAGYTESFGDGGDYWILKLYDNGSIQWQKTYGGSDGEGAYSIQQTSDGGFIVAGETESFGDGGDYWILKLYDNGSIQWQKTYGGSDDEGAYSIQQTSDGGFIVAGYTESFGDEDGDSWILKLDSNGNIPDCPYIQASNATVTNTTVTDNDTIASVDSPSYSSAITSITPSDTNATVNEICYYKQITKNVPVPTLNEWGIIILTILSGLFGIFYLRRKEI